MTASAQSQLGVLAFGTTHHAYLELDRHPQLPPGALVAAVRVLENAVLTGAGCTVVVGFRPEVWRDLSPDACPDGLRGFDEAVVGDDGFSMPASQHDVILWVAGGSRDVVFDAATAAVHELADVAAVADESEGWTYQHHRDLTGFEDGTENPPLVETPAIALVPADRPGAGGSVLLLQRWRHDSTAWTALDVADQELVIGRTKIGSVELDPKPPTSHAARTDQDEVGEIVRRNLAYGTVTKHGTMFVGLCRDREVLHEMLRRMAGIDGEPRDALTRYSQAETGAYYFLPSLTDLVELGAGDSR
jgi:putative iron-dependent peroxidase